MIETVEEYLYNRKENSVYFILIIFISLIGFLDTKYIVSLGVVLFIFLNMNDIKEKIIQGGELNHEHFFYNDKIHDIVEDLRKYRKYNINSYNKGSKYLKKFFKLVYNIERVDMIHVRQSFENAHYYLNRAINTYQSMTISVKEKSYEEHLKFKDNLRSVKIGQICKELYKECYILLWNLSKKIDEKNKDKEHLDRYKTYFNYDTSITESYDKYKNNNELY
tara:strand:+ start:6799 stop:7461 length:663 start_codon:yes stop_codon:yes gene_type:complete